MVVAHAKFEVEVEVEVKVDVEVRDSETRVPGRL